MLAADPVVVSLRRAVCTDWECVVDEPDDLEDVVPIDIVRSLARFQQVITKNRTKKRTRWNSVVPVSVQGILNQLHATASIFVDFTPDLSSFITVGLNPQRGQE